jgi:hypothetical protein
MAFPDRLLAGGPLWWHRPPTTRALDIASFVNGIIISNRGSLVDDSGRATIDALR